MVHWLTVWRSSRYKSNANDSRLAHPHTSSCQRIDASHRLQARSVEVGDPEFCWIWCEFFHPDSTIGSGQAISRSNGQPHLHVWENRLENGDFFCRLLIVHHYFVWTCLNYFFALSPRHQRFATRPDFGFPTKLNTSDFSQSLAISLSMPPQKEA